MPNSDRDSQSVPISDLAQQLGLEYIGDGEREVNAVSSFESATKSHLCFILSDKYRSQMDASECAAVIVPVSFDVKDSSKTLLFSENPHLSIVNAIDILQPQRAKSQNIHPSAQVSSSAILGKRVTIEANSVIADDVNIADDAVIGACCVIEQGAVIGRNSRLLSQVTICHDVKIGDNVIIHPGAVIGSDGFGNVYHQGKWVKIPQLGSVVIGDWVEIGANTTIDRGAMDDTIIENGVRLDNQIQVAHNVYIGENTAMAACVGIAGSAKIGKNCRISGGCCIMGHLEIADNVTVTAMSIVTKSIKQSGTYSSGTPLMENRLWHRNNVRYKSLDHLAKEITDLKRKK